jgi:hypothetical protein
LNAALAANMNLSASAVAKLEALASLCRTMGLSPFGLSAVASLNVSASSMNAGLPSLQALLSALLNPAAAALAELLKLTSTLNMLNGLTGVNLALPGVGASLGATASAALRASLSASASASASASLSANAALAMRLSAAASALGINLGLPGGAAKLNAALSLAAKISPPAFPLGALPLHLGQMTALSQLNSVLGIDLLKKLALAQLQAALGNISANISAAFSAAASASASASLAASASATASANLSAVASAAAQLNAAAMLGLPNLGPMSLAASLNAHLALVTGINPMASVPCPSCSFF